MREETEVRARLDGPLEIRITHMPLLKDYLREDVARLMFVVEATVPVRGRVRYRVPDVLSASTGYRTVIDLTTVAELSLERADDQLTFHPPEVLDIRIDMRWLDLSNDVLNAARKPIREAINHELRKKHDRILAEANKTIRKAVKTQEFRLPLLRYLGFPY